MKQVKYFEALFGDTVIRHYCKDTKDFGSWYKCYRTISNNVPEYGRFDVKYIAFSDGSILGAGIPMPYHTDKVTV